MSNEIRQKISVSKKGVSSTRLIKISKSELDYLYNERGLSVKKIATLLDVTISPIYNALHRFKIPLRDYKETHNTFNINKEKLKQYYWIEHLTPYEIAEKIGCSKQNIHWWMRKYRIPRREQREANLLNWTKPKFRDKTIQNSRKALSIKPNIPEMWLDKLIKENHLPFKYVGDGTTVIGGCNPDFIATDGKNRIIEVFGRPFHDFYWYFKKKIPWKASYWGRKAFFKSLGYDVMILWQDELNESEFIVRRIKEWKDENFASVGIGTIIYPSSNIINAPNLHLGRDVMIGDFVLLNAGKKTSIGDGSQVNAGSIISGNGELDIGKNTCVGYNVQILTGTDTPKGLFMVDSIPEEYRAVIRGKTCIGDQVFVGSNSVLMPNIILENGSVIGALSYVPPSMVIPEWKIVWGQPVKVIKERPH